MINLMNQDAGAHSELRRDADPANQQTSSGEITRAEALSSMLPERSATSGGPKSMVMGDAQALEAYVERRAKLAAQVRLENPSRTEEEIEARLEQFGA